MKQKNSGDKLMDWIAYVLTFLLFLIFVGKGFYSHTFLDYAGSLVGAMLCVFFLYKFSPWNNMWWNL